MNLFKRLLYFYSMFFTLMLFFQGWRMLRTTTDIALMILLSVPTCYFILTVIKIFNSNTFKTEKLKEIMSYLKIISLINSLFFLFIAFVGLLFYFQYLFFFVFLPLPVYFFLDDLTQTIEGEEAIEQEIIGEEIIENNQKNNLSSKEVLIVKEEEEKKPIIKNINKEIKDPARRQFLKVIGASGFGFIITMLLNPKKTEAAFFGSVPGPGTVALKDSSGQRIDPAEKKPTDGYYITDIDDSTPSYYGYLDKNGNWYIIKENSDGSFRYVRGSGSFASYWSSRSSLNYDYFDNIF